MKWLLSARIIALVTLLGSFTGVGATTYYSKPTTAQTALTLANWNTSWSGTTPTGTAPANFTTAGDVFILQATSTSWTIAGAWTVTGDVIINGTITNSNKNNTIKFGSLTINSGGTFTDPAATTINGATNITGTFTLSQTKTFTFTGDVTLNSGAVWNESAAAVVLIKANFTNNATTFTASTGTHTFSGTSKTISGTTTTTIGSVAITGSYTNNGKLTVNTLLSGAGSLTNGATGTLNIGGTSAPTITTLVTTTTGNTVNYSGGAQTISANRTFYNLTISGTAAKTFPTGTVTVNGTFSVENSTFANTFTGSLAYGSAAALQYNAGASARTVGAEWPSPFTASGGVIIKGTGVITLNAAKQIGNSTSVPLNITSGAKLTTGNFGLTFHGDFINAGTLTGGSSTVTITGTTATQAIGTYTTTGLTTMSKTSGTATFSGAVTGGALTINGSGGVLNLGTGLSHTFSGAVTMTAGTLNGGSSTLNLTLTGTVFSGTGATFEAGTGTVNYSGAVTQTMGVLTYNNLTLSGGSFAKTFASGTTTVNGILSIENGTTANVFTGTLVYGSAATLQYNAGTSARTVGAEWPSPFTATGGVIIKGSGTITLNGAKQLGNDNSVPLNINSGATLATSNNALTFHGDFIKAGTLTAGSSTVTLAGSVSAQSIGAITTTGLVSMTKTAGTATFTGNIGGAGLTINGSGGTLNLGTALTHTFTGDVTLTAGTLNGGTSTLNVNPTSSTAWNGTGSLFTVNKSTVVFGGANQTISASAPSFYNVTFSGSGTKTVSNTLTVSNALNISASSILVALPGSSSTARVFQEGGVSQVGGTWGSSTSSATNKTTAGQYFSGTGILNASTSARLIITGSLTQTAGNSQVLTITAAAPNGTTSTTYSGSKTLTFSGASTSPGPVVTSPTVRNSSGTTVNYGSPISVTFTNGVATITSTLYDAENALISVTDGTITSVNDDQLAITVSAATQQLNFTTQPGGGVTNSIWGTQPVVTVRDQYGNLSPSTKDVTLAISNNAGPGGVLAGTTTVTSNLSTAQAAFTDLAIDIAGAGYTLIASATGLSSATSSSFTISNPVPTVTSVPAPFLCSLTSDFTITVNGTNFNPTSVVYINGISRTTTYVSATQVTAAVLASDIASFATPSVVVTNPAPGGGSSTATPFSLNYTYVSANAVITQPTCYSSGKISLTGSGGTAPYTFDWTDISGTNNTQNRIGLDAGTYAVTVTDANGCSASSGNLVLVAATGCAPTNVCKSDVASIFSTDPDPDNTSYTWTVPSGAVINSGQGTLSISVNWTGVAIGTYQVCVVANNVCGTSISSCQSVNVKAPEISAYADPACTTGTLSLYAYGGISNSWTGPNSFTSNLAAPQIYNVSATQNGTYTVTTTDADGCSAFTTVTVAINTTPTVTSSVVSTTCGNSNGSITLSASGGSGFSYSWDDGSTANPYTGLASGNYSVTVTNSSGCSVVKNFAIVDTDGPSSSVSSTTNVFCYGSSTGAVTIANPTGGTAPYTYAWSDNNSTSTQNISGLAAGTYNVLITDAGGCQAGLVATITQPSGSLLTDVAVTNVNCYGASTGAVNLSVSGGTSPYTYAWSKSGGGFSSTSQNISSLSAGTYSVIVTDSRSCTTSLSVTVSQPAAALSGSTTVTGVKCFGGTTGQITSSVSGGTSPYTYSWTRTGGGFSASTSGISGLSAGTYSLLVTDSKGCTVTLSGTVTQPAAALSVSLGSSTPVSCYEGSNGGLNINVTGGTTAYSYLWSNGATTQNITNLVAGTYSVVVTDASSCSASFSSTVSQPAAALSVSATPTATTCNSASTGSIALAVTGGTSGYTYLWSNSATTQNVSGLATGTYSVTVTDARSCTAFASAIVTQPTAIAVSGTVTNVLCNGAGTGAIAITATGGSGVYSYTWSNEATTQNISSLAAGSYTVTVTDGNSCTGVQSFTIAQPSAISLSMVNENISCNGSNNGGINLTVSGGLSPYTYAWTKSGGGFTATTEDITGLSTGTYIVTVTDANGCTATLSSTAITQPAVLAATTAVVANVSCFDGSNGSAQAIPTGGNSPYTYLWSNSATSQIAGNLTAGTYTVIVTDSKGCTTSTSATVTQPAAAIEVFADVVDTRACAGAPTGSISLTVQNSTGLLTYVWTGPTSIGNVQNPTALSAGTYFVTVTSSAGCTAALTTTVGTASALSVSVTGFQSSCAATPDGSVYAVVSGGVAPYTYLWNNSSTQQSVSGLNSGTFSVTVTDANGCTATGSATLTAPTCVFPVAVNDVVSTVNGATISNTVQTNDSDAGYPNSQLQFVPNSIPDASVGVFTWNDALDGSYTYTPANGFVGVVTVPYKLFNPLGLVASAVLTINVYNTTGDVNTTSVNIPVNGDVSTNDNLISGTSYGNPGAPASKPIGSTASLTMNANGTYTFQADMAGVYVYSVPVCAPGVSSSCPASTLTITVNAALAAGAISGTQAICAGALPVAFGSLTPASGGTGTISYQWQKSIDNAAFTNIAGATSTGYVETGILTQTTYYRRAASTTVDPTAYTASITVTVNALPAVSISPVSAAITLGMTVTLTASGADTYSWTPAATLSASTGASVISTPEANTTYVATGTISSTGCSSAGNVTVIVNPKLTAGSIGSDQIICTGNSPLTALGNITSPVGGTGTISYQWQQSQDNVNFTNIPLNATSASYTVGTLTQTTYYRRAAYTSVDAPAYTGSVTITVLNGSGGTLSGAASVCTNINNTPLNLTGVSGTITKWQSSTTPDFSSAVTDIVNTTTSLTAANLTTTTYYRAVVVASSGLLTCPAVYSSAVTVTVNPLPTVTITPSSVAFTIGNSSTLTAGGATTYNWSPSPSLSNPTNVATVTATPVVTTTYQVAGTDNNGCVNTANVVVTVNPRLIAGNIIQDQTICLGDLTPLTAFTSATSDDNASGGTGTISYKWQSSLDNVTFTDVTTLSPTFSSYQAGTLTQTTYFRRGAQTPNDNMVFSNSVVVTVQYSEGGSISGSASVCAGTNSTILTLSGIKGTVTKWQSSTDGTSWSDIGGTSGTTAIATSNLLTTTYYRALVKFGTCNTVNSATATITVNPLPTVAIVAGSLSVTNGQSTTLTATGASTYVWSPNSGLSPSNTASTITITPTSDITYTVIGTTALGCTGTASVTITVVQPALQPGMIAMDQLICKGAATQALTSTVAASGGTGNITYQWQSSTDNIIFTDIPLATSEGYDAGTLTATTYYRRSAVTDGGDPVVYSNVVKITVQESNAGTLTGSATVCAGTNNTNLSLTGITGSITTWQSSPDGSSWTNINDGNTTTSRGVVNLMSDTYYRALVQVGTCPVATSNAISITVIAPPVVSITPTSFTIPAGSSATISVSGNAQSYLWTPSTGLNTTTSATVIASPRSTITYQVTGTLTVGGCTASQTASVTVVLPLTPGVIAADQTICTGTAPAAFTSTGDASGGVGTISYQWQSSTDNINFTDIIGATAATYGAGTLTQTTYFRRGAQTTTEPYIYTNAVQVTIQTPVGGTINGGAVAVCAGTNNTNLSLTGFTGSITKWQSATSADFSSGVTDIINTTSSLTAANLTTTTYYRAVVMLGSCATVTSTTATITVNPLPNVAINPTSVAISSGFSTTLTASGANTYSWVPSTGLASTNTISVTASPTGTTVYVVTGTNTVTGCVNTATSTVTVNNPLVGGSISADQIICMGTAAAAFTSTVDPSGGTGAISYQWEQSTDNINFTAIVSANGLTYTAGTLNQTTYFRRAATTSNDPTRYSNTVTVTVNPLPTISGVSGTLSICSGATTTLTASSAASLPVYKWYTAPSGGTLLSTGAAYTTSALTSTTTYYVEVTSGAGCVSASRTAVTVTVNDLPTISGITGTLTICSGLTTTLTTSSAASTPTYNWYAASSGGSALFTGAAYTTSALTTTTTFYVEVTNGLGCTSAPRTASTVTVNPLPTISGVTGTTSICSGISTTLTASSAANTPTYNWYSASSGGTLLSTSAAYATSALTNTTTFYVSVTSGEGCTANSRLGTTVTVNAAPTISGVSGTLSICSGTSTTLTASSGAIGPVFTWYDAASGGNLLHTGAAYSTAALTTTTTYYIEVTSGAGCVSASRTAATVTVNALPTISGVSGTLTVCSGSSTILTASSAASSPVYKWYAAASGGNALLIGATLATANLTSTTTYYVEVTNGAGCVSASRTAVTVDINPLPTISGVTGTMTICSGLTTTLTAGSGANTPTYKWYTASSGGTLLSTGAAYTTAALTTTTAFYIDVTSGEGCVSASRTVATVTVNPLPTISGVSGTMTICTGLTTTLTASSGANTPTYKWYSASSGGTLLSTGAAYTTSALTATTTFYIEVTSGEGCVSAARTATTVTVNPLPTISSVTGTLTICSGLTTTLTANSGANTPTYKWYSASTGGTLLSTSAVYTTSTLTSTTTFYIEVTSAESCVSASRTAATVTVNPLPAISGVTGTMTICSGLTTTLTAGSGANTPTYKWYTASTGGTLLSTGAAYTTAALTATTTFYIEVTSGEGCVAASRAAAAVTVNSLPTIIGVSGTMTICSGLTTTLTASSGANTPTYKWYTASSGGTQLFTGAAYTTAALTGTTTFYIEVTSAESCVSASRTTATVTVNPLPTISGVSGTMTICSGLTTTLTASSGANTPTYKWYSASTGGTLLSTSASYTTAALTGTSTYYIEVTSAESCVSASRTAATVTVNPLPAISGVSGTMTICSGLSTTLTATSGANTPTYSWYSASTGGSLLATGAMYTASGLTTTTTLYVSVTSGEGCASLARTAATVTVNALPSISGISGALTVCPGLATTLTANSGANTPTYNWYSASGGGTSISTGAAYTTSALTTTTTLYVEVTSGEGCVSLSRTAATVNVSSLPTISGVSGSLTLCSGFTTTLTASSGANTPTYNWYTASSGGALLSTGEAYTTAPLTTTTSFYVEVTNGEGCVSATRTTATVTVNTLPAISGVSGTLSVCPGVSTTLTANSGASTPTYNWYSDLTGGTLLSTGAAYTTSALTTTTYYVDVTNGEGCVSASRTAATLTITPLPVLAVTASSQVFGISGTVILTVSGADSYTWTPTGGLTSTTGDSFTATLSSTTMFAVTGTFSPSGCTGTSAITITVINPGSIGSDQTGCGAFTPTTLTSITPAGDASGTAALTYQWQSAIISPAGSFADIPGATDSIYTAAAPIGQTTYYRRIVTSGGISVTSNIVTATVNSIPVVTVSPTSITIQKGFTATMTASGATAYAWSPTTDLSSSATATVITSAVSSTTYSVTGTSDGCASTVGVDVTVIDPGTIGASQVNCGPFTPATLTSLADASGTATITYQWQSSTVSETGGFSNISAATATSYTPAGPVSATTYYRRIATGAGASYSSNVITATVNALPVISINPTSLTLAAGLTATLTASGADTYTWSPSTALSSTTTGVVIVSAMTNTNYSVVGTVSASGCSSTTSIAVTISSPGTLNPGTIDSAQTICSLATPTAFTSTAATGGLGTINYQWQMSTDGVNFTNIIGATAATYAAGALSQTTYYRRGASTSNDPVVYTQALKINVLPKPVIIGGINGPCALPRDTVKTFSVNAAANATRYVWTIPSNGGWSGSSTTNSINVKAGTTNGMISVTPYNGSCAGSPVSYSVSIIDYAKVTISGTPVTASGNNNNPIKVTITLIDVVGNILTCSGGPATLCANSGTFTTVVDNGDGTYTSYLTSSANDVTICGAVAGVQISQTTKVTFTGPQGGIKTNGPILDFEIPKLTFTATAGRAPFTVIYHSAKSPAGKNDTLTNVTSGTAYNVKLIPSTTLYTLVAVIDANGERRDNNFIRDTSTTVVLAPKVIITLKADAPKKEQDSTWATRIVVHTKNIGDLDLSNAQARLNLKTVFPSPVTYVLDSVRVSGRTVVLNRNYDGVANEDLFAKLNKPHRNIYNHSTPASELGLGELVAPDGSAGVEIWSNGDDGTQDGNDEFEVINNGHSIYMFGPSSALPINAEATIILWLHVKPNGYTDPFVMQAVALGTGSTEGATALTTSLSNDNEEVSAHPEVTKQGDPLPAVINLFPTAVIGASLNAGTPVLQSDGSYNVPLTYNVKNYGNVNLKNVQLSQNLLRSIGLPSTFTVVGPVTSTGNLIPNPGFNAKSDTNMLLPANSILGYKQESTLSYVINIKPNQLSSVYRLQAIASGYSDDILATVTDLSNDGLEPDTDGNNIPSEKIITVIVINVPVPPLVPGNISTPAGACVSASSVLISQTTAPGGGLDAYQYQWQSSVDNITFFDIIGAESSSYTTGVVNKSTYYRRATISGSQVKYSNTVLLQIYPAPAVPVITGTGSMVVGKGNITLSAPLAAGYAWSTGATTKDIYVQDAGYYGLTITDANGCTAVAATFAITSLDPNKVADVQKILSKAPALLSDGSFLLSFNILASNLRAELLDSVKLKDDLSKVFPSYSTFSIVDIKASGALIANTLYDGKTQVDLLSDVSKLAGAKTDSVQITIKVFPNGFNGVLQNVVNLSGRSPYGTVNVVSNDPIHNSNPSIKLPTKFTIPLVDIFIPSGFSPNKDGFNDKFVIIRPYNTTINLEIFNRWSNLVYRSNDYKNEWDGKGNQVNRVLGDDLPDGTYYYVVLATDKTTGTVRKFAGVVTIKR